MTGKFESCINLENKDACIADLQSVEIDIQKSVIAELKKSGRDIVKGLKAAFPTTADIKSASVPGSIPFVQTGELKKSIYSKIMPLMLGEPISLRIGHLRYSFYGHMLEFGTSKMAARPWFYTGILRLVPFLKGRLETMLARVIRRRNEMRPGQIRRGRMTHEIAHGELLKDIAKLEEFSGL